MGALDAIGSGNGDPDPQLEGSVTEISRQAEDAPGLPPVGAVALSGGGHRAALFGLGALWALSDIGMSQHVSSISSVSGGSITSAHIGKSTNFRRCNTKAFSIIGNDLASKLARDWSILRTRAVWLYLVLATALIGASIAVTVLTEIRIWQKGLLIGSAVGLSWWGRWSAIDAHFKRIMGRLSISEFMQDAQSASRLALPHQDSTDHVICATSLESGRHLYMSSRFIFAPVHGWSDATGITWADAVRSSTALPGPFPPKWLSARRLRFSERRGAAMKRLPLVDGGVYDNMADQWPAGLADRLAEFERLQPALEIPDYLVVVNSSADLAPKARYSFRFPLAGEIRALMRAKNIMYSNAATLRTQGLIGKFDRSALQTKRDARTQAERAVQLAVALRGEVQTDIEFATFFASVFTEDNPAHAIKRIEQEVSLDELGIERAEIPAVLDTVRDLLVELGVAGELVKSTSLPMRGVIVEIDESPFGIIDKYTKSIHALHWPARSQRAGEVRNLLDDHLGNSPEAEASQSFWTQIRDANASLPTNLTGVGAEVAGRLMYHAYMLTIVKAYVIFGNDFAPAGWINRVEMPSLSEWVQRAA